MRLLPCLLLILPMLVPACASPHAKRVNPELEAEVQRYLDGYNATYQRLAAASNEAQWVSNTHIVEGDDTNSKRTQAADEGLAAYTGSVENIETARTYLERRD